MLGYKETVVLVHPLSYRRGALVDFLNFLSKKGCLIGHLKKVSICSTTASVIGWTYNDDGWNRALETVAFLCYIPESLDDVIGFYTNPCCKTDTLKGFFGNSNLSKHDSLVEYSKTESKTLLYKDMFSL